MATCCAILEAAKAAITFNCASFPTCYGPEYISGKLMEWAEKQGFAIHHIQSGQPQQNAYIERYNRTVRHEWLDQYSIETIKEAQGFGRPRVSPRNGSALTTTTALTWASAESHPPRT